MWFLGSGLAIIVATVLLGLIAQSVASASTPVTPTQAKAVYHKMIDLSGTITFAKPSGRAYDGGSQNSAARQATSGTPMIQKLRCDALTVTLTGTGGKTLGSATATQGSEPGTCTYKLRGNQSVGMALTVTETAPQAIEVQGRSGHSFFMKLPPNSVVVDPKKGSTQTVPLTVTVENK